MINFAVNFFFGDVMQLKWQSDVVEYGARTQQVEVLKNHADLWANCAQLISIHVIERFTIDSNASLRGFIQKIDCSDKSWFTGTGAADNAENFPFIDVKGYIFDSVNCFAVRSTKGLREVVDVNHRIKPKKNEALSLTQKKGADTKKLVQRNEFKRWCRLEDLNSRPSHYECAALPTELNRLPIFSLPFWEKQNYAVVFFILQMTQISLKKG